MTKFDEAVEERIQLALESIDDIESLSLAALAENRAKIAVEVVKFWRLIKKKLCVYW